VTQALKAMILCQQTKTILDKDNKYKYEYLFREDEVVFEFCAGYNYRYERPFKNDNKLEYSINIKGNKFINIRSAKKFKCLLKVLLEKQRKIGRK
jgi:hypothetical protein